MGDIRWLVDIAHFPDTDDKLKRYHAKRTVPNA